LAAAAAIPSEVEPTIQKPEIETKGQVWGCFRAGTAAAGGIPSGQVGRNFASLKLTFEICVLLLSQ
jgi:hypothetical protein